MDYVQPPAHVYHQLTAPTTAASLQAQTGPLFYVVEQGATWTQNRKQYRFNHPWFETVRPDWEELTSELRSRPLRALEVGSFEGCSTTWMLDNLMDHPDSRLTSVDWFEGSPEHDTPGFHLSDLEEQFWGNIAKTKHPTKLRQLKGTSAERLVQLRTEKAVFDFIYIDASHTATDVLEDMALAWPMLEVGGTMVLDDYRWVVYRQPFYAPKLAIDAFLQCNEPTLTWFERNGQIWVQKTPNSSPPVWR